jgi:membrane-associated phospholipid phosphatase
MIGTMNEPAMMFWVHGHASPLLDAVARVCNVVGGTEAWTAAVSLAVLLHFARGERRVALVWLVVGLTTVLILEGLKPVFGRARPEVFPHLVVATNFSFPSGHSLASAAFCPLLAWEAARVWPARTALWYGLAIAAALMVGASRVYAGVHWPTDVAGGWTLGTLSALIGLRVLRRLDAATGGVAEAR